LFTKLRYPLNNIEILCFDLEKFSQFMADNPHPSSEQLSQTEICYSFTANLHLQRVEPNRDIRTLINGCFQTIKIRKAIIFWLRHKMKRFLSNLDFIALTDSGAYLYASKGTTKFFMSKGSITFHATKQGRLNGINRRSSPRPPKPVPKG
jgi:hypothetical protein